MEPGEADELGARQALPRELLLAIFTALPNNVIACTIRLLSKGFAAEFSAPQFRIVRLGSPDVPTPVLLTALHDQYVQRHMSFEARLWVLGHAVAQTRDCGELESLRPHVELYAEVDHPTRWSTDPTLLAARASNTHALAFLRTTTRNMDRYRVAAAAAEHADLATLQWVCEHLFPPPAAGKARLPDIDLELAVRGVGGRCPEAAEKVSWMLSLGHKVDAKALECAAERGDLALLQRLAGLGGKVTEQVLQSALQGGQLHVADWLVEQCEADVTQPDWCTAALRGTVLGGHRASLDWLLDLNPEPLKGCTELRFQALFMGAVCRGSHAVIGWLAQQAPCIHPTLQPCNYEGIAGTAAATGRHSFALLRALADAGRWGPDKLQQALPNVCHKGDMVLLRWLLSEEGGCSWSPEGYLTTQLAGSNRAASMEILRWLRATGRPLSASPEVLCAACRTGDYQKVRWVMEELGAPVSPRTLAAAAQGGCAAVLEAVLQAGAPLHFGADAYAAAVGNNDYRTVVLLRERGVPWRPDILVRNLRSAAVCAPPSLRLWAYLLDSGVDFDETAVRAAARSGHWTRITAFLDHAAASRRSAPAGQQACSGRFAAAAEAIIAARRAGRDAPGPASWGALLLDALLAAAGALRWSSWWGQRR